MIKRLSIGAWGIGIGEDVAAFTLDSRNGVGTRALVASAEGGSIRHAQAVVEIEYRISGKRPHALIAAEYWPSGAAMLQLEVARGGLFDLDRPGVKGPLDLPMVPGLPEDFAEAAAKGFSSLSDLLLPGRVKIHGGAIDADASEWVFERCGAALRVILMAEATNKDPATILPKLVATW
jgi:hypothetical protein